MEAPATSRQCVRFGPFETDFRSEELRKHGNKVKLQGQPAIKRVAILGFAVCLFSALGIFLLYLWITHQVSNREGWEGLR
jgi:hypothetical protein